MPNTMNSDFSYGDTTVSTRAIASNGISPAITVLKRNCRISVHTGAGATARVYKSSSPIALIEADRAAGKLTYAIFNSGDLSTLQSNWFLWSKGARTAPDSEGDIDSGLWTGVLCTSTGGTSSLEVIQSD